MFRFSQPFHDHNINPPAMAIPYKWPQGARTAIALTFDNMAEAADLQRGLWPSDQPLGSHYSVTQVLPKMLALLKKYDIYITYFIESWNLNHYASFIANEIAGAGHEVAWHAFQHENWGKLDEREERENFEKSFGKEGLGGFIDGKGKGRGKCLPYRGFRPPGGQIHGDRTLSLCKEYGLGYISPAAENASVANVDGRVVAILPFRWRAVDAYYYMEALEGLRKLKGEQAAPFAESELVERYTTEIDKAIESGEFLSLLFHPFLTNSPARMDAFETVVAYLAQKRSEGVIWLARCRDIDQQVRQNQRSVSSDPQYDLSDWS